MVVSTSTRQLIHLPRFFLGIPQILWSLGILWGIDGAGFWGPNVDRILGGILCSWGLYWSLDKSISDRVKAGVVLVAFLTLIQPIDNSLYFISVATAISGWATTRSENKYLSILSIWVLIPKILLYLIPEIQTVGEHIANFTTHFLAGLLGSQVELGTTFIGFNAIWIALLAVLLTQKRKSSAIRNAIVMLVAWMIGITAFNAYPLVILDRVIYSLKINNAIFGLNLGLGQVVSYLPLGFIITVFAILFLSQKLSGRKVLDEVARSSSLKINRASWIVLSILGVVIVLLPYLRFYAVSKKTPDVCFIDQGMLEYHSPSFDTLGTANSGMFGLFERALFQGGYHVDHCPRLSDLNGKSYDLVIIINPQKISDGDVVEFQRLVNSGHSALVLGDHTDLAGIQSGLNRLLVPYGAFWRFDSAFPITPSWNWKFTANEHPATRGLGVSDEVFQQGTGASIQFDSIAWYPLVLGTYTFSDAGNRMNKDAFLGDYMYEPGERLGDLPIVAERTVGKAKIVAFGDTSCFENIAIAHSWPFVSKMITYMCSDRLLPLPFCLAVILAVCGFAFYYIRTNTLFYSIMGGAIAVTAFSTTVINHRLPTKYPHADLAAIDVYSAPNTTLDHWRDRSIDGLMLNCFRNSLWPIVQRDQLPDPAAKTDFIIAPEKPIGGQRARLLLDRVSNGMRLFISAGGEESKQINPLLEMIGCQISDLPLGPVPLHPSMTPDEFVKIRFEPQFSKASPLILTDKSWHPIYSWREYPIIAERPYGKGTIIVISDTQYLWDKTLEAEKDGWPGNITLLSKIICGDYDK